MAASSPLLSVNINKIATLRNARGGQIPDVLEAARRIQAFGAQGITVHPRPDQRHIRYQDVEDLRPVVDTEFNVEGYPDDAFMELVLRVRPNQVTLVPDPPHVLTSQAGWDTQAHATLLVPVIQRLKEAGIRTSLFVECNEDAIEGAAAVGADRIELYTEDYAVGFLKDPENAVAPYAHCAAFAHRLGLGVNAGHDLNADNLAYFAQNVPHLQEVSIGHALIADALYWGLENTVQIYRRACGNR
jgi:pyridoxine 5-phosphate synthase